MHVYECKMEDGSGFAVAAENMTEAGRLAEEYWAVEGHEIVSIIRFK